MRMDVLKKVVRGVLPLGLLMANPVAADPWEDVEVEQYGTVTLNYDAFPKDSLYTDQDDVMSNIDARPQMVILGDDYEIVLEPRVVIPHRGTAYVDLKEGFFNTSVGNVDVLVGTTTVFWGKTEAVNLVDIINTQDYSRGLQSGEKQGMPMVNMAWHRANLILPCVF